MGNWQQTNQPCPCGLSSDAFAINSEGQGHCFSCTKHFFADQFDPEELGIDARGNVKARRYVERELEDRDFHKAFVADRGISQQTMEYYGVQTKLIDELPLEVGFPYGNNEAFQIRKLNVPKKEAFRTVGPIRKMGLFGKKAFDPGSKASITITEGAYDAMSIYQVTGGRTAACSVQSASLGVLDCTIDRNYINSFDKIILCPDNDANGRGQEMMQKIARMFDPRKVFIVKLNRHKDANDYLQKEENELLFKAWEGARRYTPDNIINSFDDLKKSLEERGEEMLAEYPHPKIQEMTYGMHEGEIVVLKGQTGIGKTELFRWFQSHILRTTKHPIGVIHLEEMNGTTIKAFATYFAREPIILPDSGYSNDQIMDIYREAVGGDEDRVFIHSSFDLEDEDAFLDNIRFLVTGSGCRIIFLDHITWLATGTKESEDERRKLDRISQAFKLLAKELGFCLVMISHTNDEGKTRGSRNIEKVGNTIIHLERDKVHADEEERLKTYLTVEKVRLGGRTGPAGYAYFDRNTYTLLPEKPAPVKPELGD